MMSYIEIELSGRSSEITLYNTCGQIIPLNYDAIGHCIINDKYNLDEWEFDDEDPLSWLPSLNPHLNRKEYFSNGLMRVGRRCTSFSEDKGNTISTMKYGFINERGEVVIPIIYDDATHFSNGKAILTLKGRKGVITMTGHFIVELKEENILIKGYDWASKTFDGNNIIVSKDGKEGLINSEMDVILPIDYSLKELSPYGYVICQNNKYGICSTDGKIFIKCKYQDVGRVYSNQLQKVLEYPVSEGLCIICENDKYGYLNIERNKEYPAVYEEVKPFSGGLGCVKKNGFWGFVNEESEIIIPYQYIDAFPFEKEVARVKLADSNASYYALIDKKGCMLTDYKWKQIQEFHDGFAAAMDAKDNRGWTFINDRGIPISDNRYRFVGAFEKGFAYVSYYDENPSSGKINKDGDVAVEEIFSGQKWIVPSCFRFADPLVDGIRKVGRNNRWGFVDKNFNVIVPIKFTKVESFEEERAKVWQNSFCSEVSKDGMYYGEISAVDYDLAIQLEKYLYIVLKESKWGVVSTNDNFFIPCKYEKFEIDSRQASFAQRPDSLTRCKFILFHAGNEKVIFCIHNRKILKGFDEASICNNMTILYKNDKCGLINKNGDIIMPLKFDSIKIIGENISAKINNIYEHYTIIDEQLHKREKVETIQTADSVRMETPTYERYAGSYAQDEMGYSDDDIDTIFDGDPDAYWNID